MPIQVNGAFELIERLEGLSAGLLPAAKEGADIAMQQMVTDAKANCPVDIGELRGSIQAQVTLTGDKVSAKLYTNSDHGLYVEMGTGPKGEANHAGTAPTGATYHTKGWVYHDEKGFHYTTGQPARPFLYPAFKANKNLVLARMAEAIRRRIKGG